MDGVRGSEADPGPLLRLLEWRVEEYVAGLSMIVVVGSVLWGVITRYVFPQPAPWSFEIATIFFGYVVFFGAAAGVRYRMHADIDMLVVMFPAGWQRAVAWFNFLLLSAFFLALTVFFVQHAISAHRSVTVALGLPRSVGYAPLAAASALMLLRHLQVWFQPGRFPADAHEGGHA